MQQHFFSEVVFTPTVMLYTAAGPVVLSKDKVMELAFWIELVTNCENRIRPVHLQLDIDEVVIPVVGPFQVGQDYKVVTDHMYVTVDHNKSVDVTVSIAHTQTKVSLEHFMKYIEGTMIEMFNGKTFNFHGDKLSMKDGRIEPRVEHSSGFGDFVVSHSYLGWCDLIKRNGDDTESMGWKLQFPDNYDGFAHVVMNSKQWW